MIQRTVEGSKIRPEHFERAAYVYVRQSSMRQVRQHNESARRQYELVDWICSIGWPKERVVLVDEDQGKSGANPNSRSGFERLASAVGRREVGIVVALEATRLARNSPDWHQLMYMCRWTDTLIADDHTIYDPTLNADRAVLGMRGQMSELEIELSIKRMQEARWNKAARGELMTIPPAGYDLDDLNQLQITSDEAVRHAIQTVFDKLPELGSARQILVWWQKQGLKFPVRRIELRTHPVLWLDPVYRMFLQTLRNPIYAGAYVFGKSETVRELDPEDPTKLRIRRRSLPEAEWRVLIRDHHPGYISYEKYGENRRRLQANSMMKSDPNQAGPVREGAALLQGLVRCGHCGRTMGVGYGGSKRGTRTKLIFQYRCYGAKNSTAVKGCQTVGGKRIDQIVVATFLDVTEPAMVEAAAQANEELSKEVEASQRSWSFQVEKAEYEAERAHRQYDAVEPENRLVARQLEKRWNERLAELEETRQKANEAQMRQPRLSDEELRRVACLATSLGEVWAAETTTNRDRKNLLRCLIEEVQLRTESEHYQVRIVWKGGAATDRLVKRQKRGTAHRTSEEDIELVRKLAKQFDDAQIARTLNRQGRRTGLGNAFTKENVSSLRGRHKIPKCPKQPAKNAREGPFTADEAASELGVCTSTVHRWVRDGVLAGQQATSGAPWRIILTEEVRKRLSGGEAPDGWVGLTEAARRLGLSKPNVAHLVNTGKLPAVRTTVGKRQVWRIDVSSNTYKRQMELFEGSESAPPGDS
jgi:DNA invertase Pin-like site-specific DNA recombinase